MARAPLKLSVLHAGFWFLAPEDSPCQTPSGAGWGWAREGGQRGLPARPMGREPCSAGQGAVQDCTGASRCVLFELSPAPARKAAPSRALSPSHVARGRDCQAARLGYGNISFRVRAIPSGICRSNRWRWRRIRRDRDERGGRARQQRRRRRTSRSRCPSPACSSGDCESTFPRSSRGPERRFHCKAAACSSPHRAAAVA